MLRPEEMTKLRILCSKSDLKKIIEELYKAKAVDIIHHKKSDDLDIGSPMQEASEISDSVVKARSMIYRLKIDTEKVRAKELAEKDIGMHINDVIKLNETLSETFERQKAYKAELKSLNESKAKLEAIEHLGVSLHLYKETKHLKYHIGNVDDDKSFKQDLAEEIGKGYEAFSILHMNKPLISVFINKEKEWKLLEILRKHSFAEVKIPEEYKGSKDALKTIDKAITAAQEKLDRAEKEIMDIKKKHSSDLVSKERLLAVAAKKAEAPLMFAETKNLAMISGWVPTKNKKKVKDNLAELAKNNIDIAEESIEKEDSPPVMLDNPKAIQPYEFLLRLFSMPSYKELDPALFMFITFPLFFGLMLGDFGYGLTTLALFSFLKLKMPKAKALLNIMIFCSISAIIFGAVYGEAFGFEVSEWLHEDEAHNIEITESHLSVLTAQGAEENTDALNDALLIEDGLIEDGHITETAEEHTQAHDTGEHAEEEHTVGFGEWITTWPWHRAPSHSSNVTNLIILSLLMGAFHVNLGLIFGFINVLRQHGLMHAIYEKGAWFLLEAAAALIGLSFAGIIFGPDMMWVGIALIFVAGLMLFKGEGVQGLVELPSIFVHIGSYMRLMAIGLASVGLALVINEQSMPLFSAGIFGIIAGILIFTIGHTINIALGVIGPFLHSLRLHYVEHFTKFYKGGGKEFSPFGADEE